MKIELSIEQLKSFYKQAYNDGREAKMTCGALSEINDYSFPMERIYVALAQLPSERLPYAFTPNKEQL